MYEESEHWFSKEKTQVSSNMYSNALKLSIFLFNIDSMVGTNHLSVCDNKQPLSIIPSYLLFFSSYTQQSGSDFQYCVFFSRSKTFSCEKHELVKKIENNNTTTVGELIFIRKNWWCFDLAYWGLRMIFSIIWR